MKKLLSRAIVTFTAMALAIGSFATPAQAASTKTKAINSYKKYLSQKNLKAEYDPGEYDDTFPSKGAYFSLVYLDNDKVPELLVRYTKDGDGGGVTGAGQIRIYKKGKSVMYSRLSDYKHKTLIYAKKGIVDEFETDEMGGYYETVSKYKKGTGKVIANRQYDSGAKKYTYTTSAKKYKASVKSATKGLKGKKIQWHQNTKKNRAKYLK